MKRDNNRLMLIGGAAAIAIVAGLGGALLARSTVDETRTPAAAAEAEEGEEAEAGGEGGEESAGEEGVVALEPARIQTIGIELLDVQAGGLGAEIIAAATVAATSQGQAGVAARADGAVTRINRRLGDFVGAGDTLAVLESREASSIAAERSAANARAGLARATLAREQRLFNAKVTARQDLEAAQSALAEAEAEVRRTTAAGQAAKVTGDGRSIAVTSPISGRVTAAPAVLGSFVSAGTELFRITNPNSIQVEAAVPVGDAARLRPGDVAELETPSGRFSARVRAIVPAADPESRALTVVLTPSGGIGVLQPGQGVRARIRPSVAGAAGSTIAVPEEAVQSLEGRDVVFLRTPEGFRAQPVATGQRGGGRVEIISGLQPDQTIAARNAFLLKAELAKGEGEEEE